MHPLIYDVAVSIDGYISGPDGDISRFAHDGPVVDDYMARLSGYAVAIMGRATYEFGYRFGLEPGQNPYPHMETWVFSRTLALPGDSAVRRIGDDARDALCALRARAAGPIYLCGGGELAGALMEAGAVDFLRLKRAPIVLGGGTRLFGARPVSPGLELLESRDYGAGYLFQEYRVASARRDPT